MRSLTCLALVFHLWRGIAAFTSPSSHRFLRRPFVRHPLHAVTSNIPEQYPLARKKLIQKAREIDPNLEKNTSGSYSDVGWSNRLGTVITPAAIPGVYTACRPFYWNKIDVGCRMTIIELSTSSDGSKPDLFIHSPVNLDRPLIEAVDKLGTVKHVVSPNYEHVKYAKVWQKVYDDANFWACPGMIEREPDVKWTGEIPYSTRPLAYGSTNLPEQVEGMWDWDEIQPLHFDTEVNPFTNRPFFNEVVFFHTPSKTLLMTDTYWNYPGSDGVTNSNYDSMEQQLEDYGPWELAPNVENIPIGSRLWKVGMDKLFRPFYLNLMVKNEKQDDFQKITSFISGLSADGWDAETMIPAHGDIVRGSGLIKSVLKEHFNLSAPSKATY